MVVAASYSLAAVELRSFLEDSTVDQGWIDTPLLRLYYAYEDLYRALIKDELPLRRFVTRLYTFLMCLDDVVEGPQFFTPTQAPVRESEERAIVQPHHANYDDWQLKGRLIPYIIARLPVSATFEFPQLEETGKWRILEEDVKLSRTLGRIPRSIQLLRSMLRTPGLLEPFGLKPDIRHGSQEHAR